MVPALFIGLLALASNQVAIDLADADDDEQAELYRYLRDISRRPADADAVADATRMLEGLGRFKRVKCEVRGAATQAVHVGCRLTRARVLRDVRLEGLPLALLETDVKKRVFLRAGEPIDEDEASGKSRLVRQRQRIEEFLEREGFLGAEVRLLVERVGDKGEHDVVIRVRGGDFPRVRRVDLNSWEPLSQRELQNAYGLMCWTSDGALDGAFLGKLNCYNRRRLQATTERFTAQLVDAGWPEARVRAVPRVIDAARSEDPDCARRVNDVEELKKRGLPVPPLCVDIVIEVEAGRRVRPRFHMQKDEPVAVMPPVLGGTALWLVETFLEPVSRAFQQLARDEPSVAEDTRPVGVRMEEALTFRSASSTDETEVGVSAEALGTYLERRGFVDARITTEHEATDDELVVDFTVAPTRIGAVSSVRFIGNRAVPSAEILKKVELAARPRAWDHSGALASTDLAEDERRLRDYLATRGFPEANVSARATLSPRGEIDVTFAIEEGERFLLSAVVLEGGAAALTPEVLAAIRHCDGGSADVDERPPLLGADCAGAALVVEELDADAQRVQAVYASHGYSNVEAVVDTLFSPDGTTVRVRVLPPDASDLERERPTAENVKPARLGEVFVVGNQLTRRDVILRDVGLDGADADGALDPITVQRGISRLRRSGLYQSVDLAYLGLEDAGDRAHVRIAVDERPAFTVDTSVGFSTEELASLQLDVRHRNVLGSMFDATASAKLGLFVGRNSAARLGVQWPRILGSDVFASFVPIAVSFTDEPAGQRLSLPSTNAGQKVAAAWLAPDDRRRLVSVGSSLSVDWRIADIHPNIDNKLVIGLGFELRYDWLTLAGEPVAPFSQRALDTVDGLMLALDGVDPTQIAAITPRVAYTNIDNPFDPQRGFAAEVFFRASPPPLVQQFYGVLGISARGYYTVWERLTLAGGTRIRTGFAAPSNRCGTDSACEWALMQSDLLLVGGERTVRGVPENQVGVIGPIYDQQLRPVTDRAGPVTAVHPGLYSAVVNLELRYTLIKQLFIGELKPALFADAGVSTSDFSLPSVDPNAPIDLRYATSVGVGLRYVMPVGPLALDLAYSPTRQTTGFHVQFGYVF